MSGRFWGKTKAGHSGLMRNVRVHELSWHSWKGQSNVAVAAETQLAEESMAVGRCGILLSYSI
jgi:hypothetical protein